MGKKPVLVSHESLREKPIVTIKPAAETKPKGTPVAISRADVSKPTQIEMPPVNPNLSEK